MKTPFSGVFDVVNNTFPFDGKQRELFSILNVLADKPI